MPDPHPFGAMHEAARARFPGTRVGGATDLDPNLHLYHAPNSICSQKVRAVLAHMEQPYESHLIDIFVGENYDPSYVRLRASGCSSAGLPLARQHLGSTSVSSGGCDACVVPTLVDGDAAEVLVDSKRICIELDRRNPRAPAALMPAQLQSRIHDELDRVDQLPNYQVLAVGVPNAGDSPLRNGFSLAKVARCDALLREHAGDEALCAAYEAKRSKEAAAAETLFDAEAMRRAYRHIARTVRELDARLAGSGGSRYLFGAEVTMADLFWGVELIRLEDIGMSPLWQDGRSPCVAAYYGRVCALPAVKKAVLDWQGARLRRRPDVELELVA